MAFNMNDIKEALEKDNIQWSGHILTKMQQRGIKIKDIINCLSNGKIIEYYEDDYPYPSCLVLGSIDDNKSIHVVCALEGDNIWMITAYYPAKSEWLDDFSKANLTKGRVNHIVDLGEGIIIIKNVPANICNQCGGYYLDTKTALEIETMVDEIRKNKAEVFIVNYDEMVA